VFEEQTVRIALLRAQTRLANAQAELVELQIEDHKKKNQEVAEEVLFAGVINIEP
jgi:hypothetical protein